MKNNGKKEIEFILDRFEGSKAVLRYERQELIVPKKALSRQAREGDVIHAELLIDKEHTKRRENIAKALLEEILKGE